MKSRYTVPEFKFTITYLYTLSYIVIMINNNFLTFVVSTTLRPMAWAPSTAEPLTLERLALAVLTRLLALSPMLFSTAFEIQFHTPPLRLSAFLSTGTKI